MPGGKRPGPSVKNPATYEALKRKGLSKSSAAAISNAALNKGYRKGRHRKKDGDDDEEMYDGARIEWLHDKSLAALIDEELPDWRDPDDEDEDDDDELEDRAAVRTTDSVNLVLDGKVRKTRDGFLVASARIARTGIQLYDGREIGRPDMATVRVYRPPEEVFSKQAMQSLAHKPITLDHPPVMVDAGNWEQYAIGHVGDEVTRDGDTVRVPMVIMDGKAIAAYERDGVKELSVGYSTELKWGKGTTPQGEAYDAIQTAIRGNHLAVVPAARGGSRLRIGDDEPAGDNPMTIKMMIDGQSIDFADEVGAKHVQTLVAKLQSELADAKKAKDNWAEEQEREKKTRAEKDAAFAAQTGEIAALKKQLDDAKAIGDQKTIDQRVKDHIELLVKADAVMEGKADFTGKDAAQIRREVVLAKMGDSAKDLDDAQMIGAFKAITANVKPRSGTERLADSLSLLGKGGGDNVNDAKAIKDKAYGEYVSRQRDAWRTPAAQQ